MDTTAADSLERALADVEIIHAAYPDETQQQKQENDTTIASTFPLHVTLTISESATIQFEFNEGYPLESSIQISCYRSNAVDKSRMEAAVSAVRRVAKECQEDGLEGGLACCAAAFDAWNNAGLPQDVSRQQNDTNTNQDGQSSSCQINSKPVFTCQRYNWISGKPLVDRKSVFIAHVCRVASEANVRESLHQLLDNNTKIQKATHNMYAYRIKETTQSNLTVLKHDNDDDGEDAAGSRLAQLLEMRNEDGVIVVVSRWYGGVNLGPKRFAHINNVARELLVHCHEKEWKAF